MSNGVVFRGEHGTVEQQAALVTAMEAEPASTVALVLWKVLMICNTVGYDDKLYKQTLLKNFESIVSAQYAQIKAQAREEALEECQNLNAQQSEWLPIETAPKDGTSIVVWGKYHDPECGLYGTTSDTPTWHKVYWGSSDLGWVARENEFSYETVEDATHWMSPKPPAKGE